MIIEYLPTIIFLIFAASSFFAGFRSGFLKKVMSFASFIIAIILTRIFTPTLSSIVNGATHINKTISEAIYNAINSSDIINQIKNIPNLADLSNMGELPDLSSIPELANIPNLPNLNDIPWLKNGIDFSDIENSLDSISLNISNSIVSIVCGIILFVILFIIIRMIARTLESANRIPVIGGVNKIFGGILGILETIVLFWVVFAVFRVLENIPDIAKLLTYIKNAPIVSSLYENNLIYNFFGGLLTSSIGQFSNS